MVLGLLVTVVPGAVERFPVVASPVEHVAGTVRLATTSWTGSRRDTTATEASLAGASATPESCDDPFALAAASLPLIEATRILRAWVAY